MSIDQSWLWIVSYGVLWVLVVALFVATVVIARLVGVLYQRVPPRVARLSPEGPPIGATAPRVEATDLFDNVLTIPPQDRSSVLIFVTPTCETCADLAPAIRAVSKYERAWKVVLISLSEDRQLNRDFSHNNGLKQIPFIGSKDVYAKYGVDGSPYAIVLDENAVVQAKGLVNKREDLESLLNWAELGPSINEDAPETKPLTNAAVEQPLSM